VNARTSAGRESPECPYASQVRARSFARDWLPFIALLIAYNMLRGLAGRFFGVHYMPQIDFDKLVFFGQNGTVFLQRHLWNGTVTWYDVACWGVYMTHFIAAPLLAAVLWLTNRERFRRFVMAILVVSFASVVTYALFPAAPPWMASQQGLIGPVTRILPHVASTFGMDSTGSLISLGYRYANNVAAVPSLHAAYSLLIAIAIWPHQRRWLRPVVALYPLAMAFTLIYTGEHYLFDVLLGWAYTGTSVFVLNRVYLRREMQVLAGQTTAERGDALLA